MVRKGGGTEAPIPRRLDEILRALPEQELQNLIRRLGIKVDPNKRIDPPSQVARIIVGLPEIRDPERLPRVSHELLTRVAEAGGILLVSSLPVGIETLVARGLVFARRLGDSIELVLPHSLLIQLPSWTGEDPRALRSLLARTTLEAMSSIAAHFLGRPATPPIALSLEAAWEVLSDPVARRKEIDSLAPLEKRLLASVEALGGEVETEELLELEKEPMRLRGAAPSASRRGSSFALERRGFLIPLHPNRHIVPSEIARIIGEERRARSETRREQIRSFVFEEDHAPRRARFAKDPTPTALAMAALARDPSVEIRRGVGTPRSFLNRAATRLGQSADAVGLISALSRAVGLWDAASLTTSSPPGACAVEEVPKLLFSAWRKGGAWDEGRPESELLRGTAEERQGSPTNLLRELLLEALQELGEGSWVPWPELSGYLAADPSISGIERLLRRWADRSGHEMLDPIEVLSRMVFTSLPVLGIVDVGFEPTVQDDEETELGDALRLTPRGRALLANAKPSGAPTPSAFVEGQALRVGTATRIGDLFALFPYTELGRLDPQLDLLLTPQTIAKALSGGADADVLRDRIGAVAPLTIRLTQMLAEATAIVGNGRLVGCSAFLWIEDPDVRELLVTRKPLAEAFVSPSPPDGLLIAPGVDLEKLIRKARGFGVAIDYDGVELVAQAEAAPRRRRTPSRGSMRGVGGSNGSG